MAANGMFGAGKDGMINPPDLKREFTLAMVETAVLNRKAYEIIRDLKLLLSIVKVSCSYTANLFDSFSLILLMVLSGLSV